MSNAHVHHLIFEKFEMVTAFSRTYHHITQHTRLLPQIILLTEYALANLRQFVTPQGIFRDAIQALVDHGSGEL